MPTQINTGIDKLVIIIKERKEVSISQAAKELGVSSALIEEWAYFLEEKNFIELDYRLSGTFMTSKDIDKAQIKEKKEKLNVIKKQISEDIKDQSKSFGNVSTELTALKTKAKLFLDKVGSDFAHIKEDILTLKELEDAHDLLNNEIEENDKDLKLRMNNISKLVSKEMERNKSLINEIKKREDEINKNQIEMSKLIFDEKQVIKNLKELDYLSENLKKKAEKKEKEIIVDLRRINILKEEMKNLEEDMLKQKREIMMLIKEKIEKSKKIENFSKKIATKIKNKKKEIDTGIKDSKKIEKEFLNFLSHKKEIKNILLSNNKNIEDDIEKLIEEAKYLDSLSKSSDIKNFAKKIKKDYAILKSKKEKTHKEFTQLSRFLNKKR